MNLKFVSRIEEVLSVALENDPNTFIPTTHWKGKDKKVSANTKRKTKNTDTMNIVL